MIINVKELVENVQVAYPTFETVHTEEEGFHEVKVIGENGSMCYFYPNDQAWFVKLYGSNEAYTEHVLEEIKKALVLN